MTMAEQHLATGPEAGPAQAMGFRCPGCDGAEMIDFLEIAAAPVHCNVLLATRAEARHAPTAPIHLSHCPECGLIYNRAFDERRTRYEATYENSLHFSAEFRRYASELAELLINRYGIHSKHVIDVGCGDGQFLAELCERGSNQGLGFDPGHNPHHVAEPKAGTLTVVCEPYGRQHADQTVDLLTCRHVLEHIGDPQRFLADLRRILAVHPQAIVYFEVPNALYTLRDLGIWDILYEHCSYFTAGSLTRLFERAGFQVVETREAYGGQFLGIEARLEAGVDRGTVSRAATEKATTTLVARFANQYRQKCDAWLSKLAKIGGDRVVVWGAGTKGVMFLNTLNVELQAVDVVVDVNPRKTGLYVPRTAQRVIAPADLDGDSATTVILMNSIYREEVCRMLGQMGIEAEVLAA